MSDALTTMFQQEREHLSKIQNRLLTVTILNQNFLSFLKLLFTNLESN